MAKRMTRSWQKARSLPLPEDTILGPLARRQGGGEWGGHGGGEGGESG